MRQKLKASKKANELISSALWVASCGLGNGARYNTARQNLEDYIAELEAESERLSQLLHDEMSQLEIATDLGNKRWAALNKIYEDGEKRNTNWCKRIAQEGLGIKNA